MTARTRPGDQAFSLVLSAMLLLGVLLTAFVTYQTTVVPVFTADGEAKHVRQVGAELLDLKRELDRQLGNDTEAPILAAITVGRERSSIFSNEEVRGTLRFEPAIRPVRLWSAALLLQEANATSLLGHPESWSGFKGDTAEVEAIHEVLSFRLKIDEISRNHAGDHILVEVIDADGQPSGSLRVCLAKHMPDYDVHVRIKDKDGNLVHNGADPYFNTQTYAPYWIDVMEEQYRFDRVLALTKAPFGLHLTVQNDAGSVDGCPGDGDPGSGGNDLSASFAITYLQRTDAGTIVRGGGGLAREDVKYTFAGGALRFSGEHAFAVPSQYFLENGGLVLDQADGAVFRGKPHFRAALLDNRVALSIATASLQGETSSLTGLGVVPVYLTQGRGTSFSAQASNLTLEVTTAHPDLWTTLWRDELLEAGLSEGTHFAVSTTANAARLDVHGVLDPDPASETYDLSVTFEQLAFETRLGT